MGASSTKDGGRGQIVILHQPDVPGCDFLACVPLVPSYFPKKEGVNGPEAFTEALRALHAINVSDAVRATFMTDDVRCTVTEFYERVVMAASRTMERYPSMSFTLPVAVFACAGVGAPWVVAGYFGCRGFNPTGAAAAEHVIGIYRDSSPAALQCRGMGSTMVRLAATQFRIAFSENSVVPWPRLVSFDTLTRNLGCTSMIRDLACRAFAVAEMNASREGRISKLWDPSASGIAIVTDDDSWKRHFVKGTDGDTIRRVCEAVSSEFEPFARATLATDFPLFAALLDTPLGDEECVMVRSRAGLPKQPPSGFLPPDNGPPDALIAKVAAMPPHARDVIASQQGKTSTTNPSPVAHGASGSSDAHHSTGTNAPPAASGGGGIASGNSAPAPNRVLAHWPPAAPSSPLTAEQPPRASSPHVPVPKMEQLKELFGLLQAGALSREEFDVAKGALLGMGASPLSPEAPVSPFASAPPPRGAVGGGSATSSGSGVTSPVGASRESSERFQLDRNEDPLGQGAFGVVYRGFDTLTGMDVAVKETAVACRAHIVGALLKEFDTLRSLVHPNVVAVHAFEVSNGRARIIMEFMAGGNLWQALQTQGFRLHEGRVRCHLRDALRGLAFLHARAVVHRDIKPGNLLLDATGQVKLADFGISRSADQVNATDAAGSLPYMAPETLQRKGAKHSPASDIWALACTVVELASGRAPWAEWGTLEPLALAYRIGAAANAASAESLSSSSPTGPRDTPLHHPEIPEQLSQPLKHLLRQMFALDPDQRPTAEALLHAPYFAEPTATLVRVALDPWSTGALPPGAESLGDYEAAQGMFITERTNSADDCKRSYGTTSCGTAVSGGASTSGVTCSTAAPSSLDLMSANVTPQLSVSVSSVFRTDANV